MTTPKAIHKDQIVGTNLAQLQAVGSNEGLQVGTFGFAEDSGIVYRCSSVDGANASSWVTASPHRYFDAKAIPEAPHPDSVEFGGGDISGITHWNPGSTSVLDAWNGFARTRDTNVGSTRMSGWYVPMPSGAWTATTVISYIQNTVTLIGDSIFGLGMFSAGAPTAQSVWGVEWAAQPATTNNPALRTYGYSNYTFSGGLTLGVNITARYPPASLLWFRIRYDPVEPRVSFDVSPDGLTWMELSTQTSSFYLTPAYVGAYTINLNASGSVLTHLAPFLRFQSGAGREQIAPGRLV